MNSAIDTVVTAETPEGVSISIRPAGFAVRAAAFLIDAVIRIALLALCGLLFSMGRRVGVGLYLLSAFVLNWLYPVLFEMSAPAATPGKRAMGLYVLMTNGLPITPAGCLIRNLLRVVDMLPLLYASAIVSILLRNDSRRLGDLAAGTVVAYRHEIAFAGKLSDGVPIPPPVPLSRAQQLALAGFAWRVDQLTPARAEEIASYAAAAAPLQSAGEPSIITSLRERLVGISRWLHGDRPSAPRPPLGGQPTASAGVSPRPALDFETTNEPQWIELEQAVSREDKTLDPERFLFLYRTACEHLALAEARGFPAPLVSRLSAVTARAHQIVYRQTGLGLGRIARTLMHAFPAMVRAHRGYVLVAALVVIMPAAALGYAVAHRPDLILSLIDSATVEKFAHMYDPANPEIGRLRDAGTNWMMFGFYVANNIGIAFQCYVSGIFFGLGSLCYLAYNGAFGGAVGGYVTSIGFAGTFFPFVASHSAFELTAVVLCGAAGLRVGCSVLLPGRLPRMASLQIAARETSVIVFGAAVMLVIAAAVEAFWSSAAWVGAAPKVAGAVSCWMLVAIFFLRRPRAD